MNHPITSTEIKTVIKNLSKNKSPWQDAFTGEFYQIFRQELTSILLTLLQKCTVKETFTSLFYEATFILMPKPDKDIKQKENYRLISQMNIDTKILNKILESRI